MLTPDDLDAEWFTAILQNRYPGVRVSSVERTRVHEWTNLHVKATLTYDGDTDGAPDRVFVKLSPLNAAKARALGSAQMGLREASFYRHLAPRLDLRVPTAHGVLLEDDGGFAIVLEDIVANGCSPMNLIGVSADQAAVALEDLASMHVRFEQPSSRTDDSVSWVRLPSPPKQDPSERANNIGVRLLRRGIEQQPERLGTAYATTAQLWIEHGDWFQQQWWDAPPTVIQGDTHPGNLFDDHRRIGFLDWGLITLGDPLRDVSYFVNLAMEAEVRRQHDRDLFVHYLAARRALGGTNIDFDTAWQRHRIHAAYLAPASCQSLAIPDGASPNSRRFSDLFLDRAIAAIEDLDVPAAVVGMLR